MTNWKKRDKSVNTFEDFLKKKDINDLVSPKRDPYVKNLKEVCQFIASADRAKTWTIMADYDADGICSGTIMHKVVQLLGVKDIRVRFPRRFSEGYGLSMKVVDECPENSILVTVDNGIAAVDEIKKAKEKGITVIVTDHHMAREDGTIPNADAVIDPNAIYDDETYRNYCGAGIAYRIMKELFPNSPDLRKMEVFAGIATVTDVMELTGDNRNLVRDAINLINSGEMTNGLRALVHEFGIEYISEGDFGFTLGPAFNAAGRMLDDGAFLVYDLISRDFPETPEEMFTFDAMLSSKAQELINLNKQRQDAVLNAMEEVHSMTENMKVGMPVVIEMDDVSSGIVGIIAGKLAEEFKAPAIVFSAVEQENGETLLKGSGRTYGDVHLKHLLDSLKVYLVGYGGHAGAAGLSLKPKNLNEFKEKFMAKYIKLKPKSSGNEDVEEYDFDVKPENLAELVTEMRKYAPYGQGNRKPVVRIVDFDLVKNNSGSCHTIMGRNKNHVKVNGPYNISGLLFGQAERYTEDGYPKRIDIIGIPSENVFRGESRQQIEISDYAVHVESVHSDTVIDFSSFLMGASGH